MPTGLTWTRAHQLQPQVSSQLLPSERIPTKQRTHSQASPAVQAGADAVTANPREVGAIRSSLRRYRHPDSERCGRSRARRT